MDWSNFKDIYKFRQTIKNSTNQSDINKAKKEEQDLLSKSDLFDFTKDGKVDIEDLISFSTEKAIDFDDVNGITEDEENFFVEMKNALYDKLAKEINKNSNLKVDDMLELEKSIRNLNSEQKDAAGGYLEKLQNRMVSNLTSQFFVTKETDSYKENAVNGAIEIWEAQYKLDEMNESANNPFNDKLENLLEKLEGRVLRTLSQDYTEKSIQDAKNTKNADALVKKTNEPGQDESKFELKDDGFLYYDGTKYTGMYSDNKYYQDGVICDGVANNGKYYEKGVLGNGAYPNNNGASNFWVIDGQIMWEDMYSDLTAKNTERHVFESYIIKDENGKTKQEAVISSVIVFNGIMDVKKNAVEGQISSKVNYENGKKVSTEDYAYYSDGSSAKMITYEDPLKESEYFQYTSTGELFSGNGVFDSKLYENFILKTGKAEYGGKLYVDGIIAKGSVDFNGILYVDGEKLTGIHNRDGMYYVEGKIEALATDTNGLVYRYGTLAQGVIKEDDKYNYYELGKKVSETDAKVGQFIEENFIENVKFEKKEDGEFDYTSFTGLQVADGSWRPVEYEFTDENNFTQAVYYEQDIRMVKTVKDGEFVNAEYDLAGTKVPVNVNGSEADTGIDYSLQYVDVDGDHPVVQISNAVGDNLTYVYRYEFANGEYQKAEVKIVIGSINDMQAGKVLTEYSLSDKNIDTRDIKDENGKIIAIEVIESIKNKESDVEEVEVKQTFGLDGKVSTGLVTFKHPADGAISTITINAGEICKVNKGKVVITVPQKDESGNIVSYKVTTYKSDGTKDGEPVEITDRNGTTKSFAEKINLDISDVQGIEIDNNGNVTKIKLEGIEYEVTYPEKDEKETILLKSDNIEKQFLNNVVIYEKAPSFAGVVTIERNEKGVQTKYRVDINENKFTEYLYDSETGNMLKASYKTADKQTIIDYAPDGKTVVNTEITTYKTDGSEESVKRYAGKPEEDKVTYEKTCSATGYEEINYSAVNSKAIDKTTVVNAVAAAEEQEAAPKTVTVITFKSDGTTQNTKTVTTYASDDDEKIAQIEVFDENERKIELTTYEENGKVVKKYVYSSAADSVVQTTTDTYDKNNIIVSTEVIDNANENRIAKRIKYEKGIKRYVETMKTYDENGVPKTSQIEEFRGGNLRIRLIDRTYTDYKNNKFNDKIGETITEVNGVKVKEEQLKFAELVGLGIMDIKYNEDDSLQTLAGIRLNDGSVSTYSDWSVNEYGQYSYIEEITFADNTTAATEDDVTYITRVENNIPQYSRIKIDGNSYPVNVNGSEINDKLDISISTELINNSIAKYVYVKDVLFDGIARVRTFTREGEHYNMEQGIAVGTLEDINDKTKSTPLISIPEDKDIVLSSDGKTVTIPVVDKKVSVQLKGEPAYDIELNHENENFKITKEAEGIVIQSSYKDGSKTVTTTYKFNEDGGYSKTNTENNAEITYTYGADGSTLKSMTINGLTIENPVISEDGSRVSVTKEYDTENGKLGYVLTYALTKSDDYNIGDLVNGGTLKFAGNKDLSLGENDKLMISSDGKSCTVTTKVSSTLSIIKTINSDGLYTELKLNDKEITLSKPAENIVKESNTVKVTIKDAKTGIEQICTYALTADSANNVSVGDCTGRTLKFSADKTKELKDSDTVEFKDEEVIITSEGSKIKEVYAKSGDPKSLIIDGSEININGAAVSYNSDGSELTLKRENSTDKVNYELVYTVATGSIKSGKLTKGSTNVNIVAGDVINEEENGYIILKRNNQLKIYTPSLVEINDTLKISSYEEYKKLTEAVAAYNEHVTTKINLNNLTVKPEIDEENNTITFASVKNSNYTENIIYDTYAKEISKKQYNIGNQVFTVPMGAAINVANGKITISFTVGSVTKTIELSKAGESSTYYDKVKCNGGEVKDIGESAEVQITGDGQIRIDGQSV